MSGKFGWIGVDLDGTLAEYHGWDGGNIGKPIPEMVERVKGWLAEGIEVRIVTARVAPGPDVNGDLFERNEQHGKIGEWCEQHIGVTLPVTCVKDFAMIELWDDRAVRVEKNTGRRIL